MRKQKWDQRAVRHVIKLLDGQARHMGVPTVKHAATKWANAQRDKARLLKQRASLQRELDEVARALR